MGNWDSKQYLKFEKERTQPSRDLIHRLDCTPRTILDVGCGPGNSTSALRQRFPGATILGIDNSEDMIAKAQSNHPGLLFRFQEVDSSFQIDGKFDLIFSNACIHWIPNHAELIPNMLNALNPGGTLAIQIPKPWNMPMYQILGRLQQQPEWTKIRGVRNFHARQPEDYYNLLSEHAAEFAMWETAYIQTMDGIEGIVEWYRGSGLRPYLAALTAPEQEKLLAVLREELAEFYPLRTNGKVMMRFPRLFFTAKR